MEHFTLNQMEHLAKVQSLQKMYESTIKIYNKQRLQRSSIFSQVQSISPTHWEVLHIVGDAEPLPKKLVES